MFVFFALIQNCCCFIRLCSLFDPLILRFYIWLLLRSYWQFVLILACRWFLRFCWWSACISLQASGKQIWISLSKVVPPDPNRIAPTTELYPHAIAHSRYCTHTGLYPRYSPPPELHPHEIAPTRDSTHMELHPHGIALPYQFFRLFEIIFILVDTDTEAAKICNWAEVIMLFYDDVQCPKITSNLI